MKEDCGRCGKDHQEKEVVEDFTRTLDKMVEKYGAIEAARKFVKYINYMEEKSPGCIPDDFWENINGKNEVRGSENTR